MQPLDDHPQTRAAAVGEALDRSDRRAQEEELRRTEQLDDRLAEAVQRANAPQHAPE